MSGKIVVTVESNGARTVDLRTLLQSDAAQKQLKSLERFSPSRPEQQAHTEKSKLRG